MMYSVQGMARVTSTFVSILFGGGLGACATGGVRLRGSLMRLLLPIAAGVLAVALATSPAAAANIISAVEVKGNQRISADTIRAQLLISPGEAYDPARADRSVRKLFATGQFADVRIEQRGAKLIVTVVENPILASVKIEGNSAIGTDKLQPLLKLKTGAPYTPAKARADAVQLRDYYLKLGYNQAVVEPRTTAAGEGRIDLVFAIREGELNKVRSITFVGNRAFSDAQLRDVITTTQSGWLDFLKSNLGFDEERLAVDRELLRRHYLKNGYADVEVSPHHAEFDPATKTYAISFKIDEGEQYTFGAVSIESVVPGLDERTLGDALLVKTGEVYNAELIEKSEEKLMAALSAQSQPFAQVKVIPSRDPASRRMSLKFLIEEGPRLFVERIEIVGNTKTKDHVIRRELGFAEGDGVNAFLLRRSAERVRKLGFFKSVEVKQKKGSADNKLIVTVEVVEEETIDLSFGAGYSTSEGVIGDVSVTERNLLGNGQWLQLKLAGSFTRLQADIGFTEPRFLGTRMAAGFDLFYKDFDFSDQSSYKAQKIGGKLRVGIPLTDELNLGLNYKFSRNTIYDVGEDASVAIKEAVSGRDSATFDTSSVGYSLTYDTRDRKKLPRSGIYAGLGQDLAGVGGDVRYVRSVVDVRGYHPLGSSVTLLGRARAGHIVGWGGSEVSLLDMFYGGGDLVRGFAPRGIGPRDSQSRNKDALGGSSYYAVTAEAMFDIPRVTETAGLRASVFADAGSLWGVNSTSASVPGLSGNSASPRVSTGAGLVWDSPIGPLRLDYAVPLVKQEGDKTQALSFGIVPY
ncbi:MAG TPA: outer membrane protein assembly factor BamA [Hyphomicrobiaceae bacterium]